MSHLHFRTTVVHVTFTLQDSCCPCHIYITGQPLSMSQLHYRTAVVHVTVTLQDSRCPCHFYITLQPLSMSFWYELAKTICTVNENTHRHTQVQTSKTRYYRRIYTQWRRVSYDGMHYYLLIFQFSTIISWARSSLNIAQHQRRQSVLIKPRTVNVDDRYRKCQPAWLISVSTTKERVTSAHCVNSFVVMCVSEERNWSRRLTGGDHECTGFVTLVPTNLPSATCIACHHTGDSLCPITHVRSALCPRQYSALFIT